MIPLAPRDSLSRAGLVEVLGADLAHLSPVHLCATCAEFTDTGKVGPSRHLASRMPKGSQGEPVEVIY